MKPLLMMRTSGLTGPLLTKHCGIRGLSKSSGNAIDHAIAGNPLGPELILDGLNPPNLLNWTTFGVDAPAAISISAAGNFRIQNNTGGNNGFGQLVAFEEGKRYRVRLLHVMEPGGTAILQIGTGVNDGTDIDRLLGGNGWVTFEFIGTLTSTALSITTDVVQTTAGEFNGLSVREIL